MTEEELAEAEAIVDKWNAEGAPADIKLK